MDKKQKKYQAFPAGIKKTIYRRHVWEILQDAEHPLTVPEIIAELDQRGVKAWQSTVYRNLESFLEQDLVRRTFRHGVDMAMFEFVREKHKHYATCLDCKTIIPLEECPLDLYQSALAKQDFEVRGHNLEIYGYCEACREHQEESIDNHEGCCTSINHEH